MVEVNAEGYHISPPGKTKNHEVKYKNPFSDISNMIRRERSLLERMDSATSDILHHEDENS